MCGIAGIMMRDGVKAEQSVLDRLADALAHRGPDGKGFFCEGSVGLLSTRLAIIDVPGGKQPFQEPGGAVLVANGEIYNDLDLRRRLADVPFKTKSDCESPLHLYRRKGIPSVDSLRGMYAIAIYDPTVETLFITRDPFGIKQLYYVMTPTFFAFASEPQALKAAGLTHSKIVAQKRSELLQLKFTTGQDTIYSDIQRLLPGETLAIKNGQIIGHRSRRALAQDKLRFETSFEDALVRLDAVLLESVAVHVRSDVPYGLFLSGGIDSAAIATVMARLSNNPIIAFTATFPDYPAANEATAAARVAHAVRAEHHVVGVTQKDFWNFSPRVAAALDDPTTDASALPTYLLAAAAKKNLKVVLSGEGADEMLGGYSRYRKTRSFWRLLGRRKARSHGLFDSFTDSDIFPGWRDGLSLTEAQEVSVNWSHMQTMLAVDCAEWLPNDLLVKFDRCLMAHGIEGRTPFLDPHVSDFAFNLPDELKVKDGVGKWILRAWLDKNCHAANAWAKKLGFNPPIGHWISHSKDIILPLVLEQPGIKAMAIEEVVRKVYVEPARNSQAAWSLLFYALWHSHHILGVDAEGSIGDVLTAAARRA